jgi:hypothetical protein
LSCLTANQLTDWEDYHNEHPWGGDRDDMRGFAHAILEGGNEELSWFYPYLKSEEDRIEEARAQKADLDKRASELDHEAVEAKLQAAKEKYFASRKKNG